MISFFLRRWMLVVAHDVCGWGGVCDGNDEQEQEEEEGYDNSKDKSSNTDNVTEREKTKRNPLPILGRRRPPSFITCCPLTILQ